MSRRGKIVKVVIDPDPIYNNTVVSRLINRIMSDGKKSVAQKQVYRAFDIIKEKSKEDALKIFLKGLENVKPSMEVRPRRVGGAAYQVPMSVKGTRRESLGIRWLIMGARSRSNSDYKTFAQKLSSEILDAAKGEGLAVKRKKEIERIAEANRAFAHFRW